METLNEPIYQARLSAFRAAMDCDPARAETELERAVLMAPDEPALRVDLSVVRRYDGRFLEAQRALADAFELDENFPAAHQAQGELHQWMGKAREGIASLEKAAAGFGPGQPMDLSSVHFTLSVLHWRLGEGNEAADHAALALKFNPNGYRAQKALKYYDRNDLRPQAGGAPGLNRLFAFVRACEELGEMKRAAFREFFGPETHPVISGRDPFDGELAFLDWFLFDRPGTLERALDLFFASGEIPESERGKWRRFSEARFSLYDVRLKEESAVKFRDRMRGGDSLPVEAPMARFFLRDGGTVSARLVPWDEAWLISGPVALWDAAQAEIARTRGEGSLSARSVWLQHREAKRLEWKGIESAVESYLAGRYDEAKALLAPMLARSPMEPRFNFYSALLEVEAGNLRKAAMRVRFVMQQDPFYEEPGYPPPSKLLVGILREAESGEAGGGERSAPRP